MNKNNPLTEAEIAEGKRLLAALFDACGFSDHLDKHQAFAAWYRSIGGERAAWERLLATAARETKVRRFVETVREELGNDTPPAHSCVVISAALDQLYRDIE